MESPNIKKEITHRDEAIAEWPAYYCFYQKNNNTACRTHVGTEFSTVQKISTVHFSNMAEPGGEQEEWWRCFEATEEQENVACVVDEQRVGVESDMKERAEAAPKPGWNESIRNSFIF